MFDLARAHALVAGTRFAHIRYVRETVSTNDDATALLGAPGSAGLVLLAEHQSGGKGRRARSWVAEPESSLLFTALLPDPIEASALWAVAFWSALAVADGIAQATGLSVTLQWPNDLLLNARKCCGILATSRVVGESAWVGCGVGLNVRRPVDDASIAEIEPAPAFLSDRVARVEREPLLGAILSAFHQRLPMLADPPAIARHWEARAELAGSRYRIAPDGADIFEGTAERLEDDGSLRLRTATGERRVTLADARVLRD